MDRYAATIIGQVLGIFLGALVAVYATRRLAGFEPRYTRTLLSTFVAYLLANALTFALLWLGAFADSTRGFQWLSLWAALTCTHVNLVRSDAGKSLGPGRAMLLAAVQIFGTLLAVIPIVLIIALIIRIFQ